MVTSEIGMEFDNFGLKNVVFTFYSENNYNFLSFWFDKGGNRLRLKMAGKITFMA